MIRGFHSRCQVALCLAMVVALPLVGVSDTRMVFSDGPKVGDKAPSLHLKKLLNAPPDASTDWSALRGKVVVLDFWATWCKPCVASIPHMNRLIDELKGEPFQFIAVTAEQEEVVVKFLKRNPLEKENVSDWPADLKALGESISNAFRQPNPIHAWIALDEMVVQDPANYYAGTTVAGYYFYGVPHCVVVDGNGLIAAFLHPLQLNAGFLRAVAKGERPAIPDPDLPPERLKEWKRDAEDRGRSSYGPREPAFEASIRRTREWIGVGPPQTSGVLNPLNKNVVFQRSGISLAEALQAVGSMAPLNRSNATVLKFEILSPLSKAPHDFKFSAPAETFPEVFTQAIQAAFDLEIHQDSRSLETFRMRGLPGAKKGLKARLLPEQRLEDAAHGRIVFPSGLPGGPMSALLEFLKHSFEKEVIYGFEDAPTFDLEVNWDPRGGFEAFKRALQEQSGFALISEQVEVRTFRVRTKQGR